MMVGRHAVIALDGELILQVAVRIVEAEAGAVQAVANARVVGAG